MSDVVELPDNILDSPVGELANLARQLGVVASTASLNGDELRLLLAKQELKS